MNQPKPTNNMAPTVFVSNIEKEGDPSCKLAFALINEEYSIKYYKENTLYPAYVTDQEMEACIESLIEMAEDASVYLEKLKAVPNDKD